jgi:hypothetical protein
MSWLGLLLVGFAVTDLAYSAHRARHLPQLLGAAAVLLLALVAGLTDLGDLLAVAAIVLLVLGWGYVVTAAFRFGGRHAAVPLTYAALAVIGLLLLSPVPDPPEGLLAAWLAETPYPVLAALPTDRALLLLGVLLSQLSTGNVLVRLVLTVTGTINPTKDGSLPGTPLKGGRLLGPMERLLILGLGLAGHLTAASIVIAAKGLLRFPELSSPRDQAEVHRMTEYFLVGSFASWLMALGGLALLG